MRILTLSEMLFGISKQEKNFVLYRLEFYFQVFFKAKILQLYYRIRVAWQLFDFSTNTYLTKSLSYIRDSFLSCPVYLQYNTKAPIHKSHFKENVDTSEMNDISNILAYSACAHVHKIERTRSIIADATNILRIQEYCDKNLRVDLMEYQQNIIQIIRIDNNLYKYIRKT